MALGDRRRREAVPRTTRPAPDPGRAIAPVPFDLPADALAGKVVVITGASRGLGAGLADRFAELGAALGLCARTEPQPPAGSRAMCGALDVTDARMLEGFGGAVAKELGPVDLWVNNAGVLDPMGPNRTLAPAEVDRALLVNVGGVANGTRTFTRRARSWPPAFRVLANISSGAASSSYEGWSIYGATKAAVDRFTEVVALEEPDVLCLAVSPGVVETDMQVAIRAADPQTFPSVERFRAIHRDNTASSPTWVADHLAGILIGALRPPSVVWRVPPEPR